MDKPKVVVLCGSSRFIDLVAVCGWVIERDEQAITMGMHLLPQWYCDELADHHQAEAEGVADAMDNLHLRKIDMADEIFVVNPENYIGSSCTNEIRYATEKGLPVRYFTDDPVGEQILAGVAHVPTP